MGDCLGNTNTANGADVAEWFASPTRDREIADSAIAAKLLRHDAALGQLSSRLHHCLPLPSPWMGSLYGTA
jgi:hypothetical protein